MARNNLFFNAQGSDLPFQPHTSQYLSHEVGEEEHVAEEGCPSQQVTDTQVAVVIWHSDDSFHQQPEGHPFLDLHVYISIDLC